MPTRGCECNRLPTISESSCIIRSVKRLGFLLLTPLLLVISVLYVPYMMIVFAAMAHSERKFAKSMRLKGRTMDWADFTRELDGSRGTLIIERFDWVGPIRSWWTTDNVLEICPYPLAEWFTMLKDSEFDRARRWCHEEYTSATGRACW